MDDYGFDCFPVGSLRAEPVPGMDMMNAGFSDSTMLGTLVAGTRHPFSPDGSTFVGRQPYKSFDRAFRYSWQLGNEWLDGVPGSYPISIAGAASADGTIVGGSGFSSDLGNSALAWGGVHGTDPAPTMLTEGLPDVATAHVYAVSWDGQIMAGGLASARTGRLYAFRVISGFGKTPFDISDLGSLIPDGDSVALDVSADGSIIVGWTTSDDVGVQHEPFRWTEATGMVGLGLFKKYGNTRGAATAISADGTVIVGWARYQTNDRAFRWTEESGMELLPLVPHLSADAFAYAVSPDGSVIVGGGYNGSRFVWSAAHGSESLDMVFTRLGVDITGYGGFLPMAVLEMAGVTYLTGIAYTDTGEQVIWRAAYE
jgi:probable HAF family extracellular repeat protein